MLLRPPPSRIVLRVCLAALFAALVGCGGCSGCGREELSADILATDFGKTFQLLFDELPVAKVERPVDALPADLPWTAWSPDPEAWRGWAVEQPFVKGLMATPLFEDLRTSRAWLTLDGLRHHAAQAAALTSSPEDRPGLWSGPTAIGLSPGEDDAPLEVVMVKAIDPKTQALVRFAAAFALAERAARLPGGGPKPDLRVAEASGVKVFTLRRASGEVSFALFRNLVVAGSGEGLVRRAAALAMKRPLGGDLAATDGGEGALFPEGAAPGLHLVYRAEDHDLLGLAGLERLGVSLVMDRAGPVLLRRAGKVPAGDALSLLAHAPEGAFFGWVDGGEPSGALFEALHRRILGAGAAGKLEYGSVNLERELFGKLAPGMAVILGGSAAPGEVGGLVVLRHGGKQAELEPPVRKVLAAFVGRKVERTVLEDRGGAILLAPAKGAGFAAALTGSALILGGSAASVRGALDASSGKAPSFGDRSGVELGGAASGGVLLDLARLSSFLEQLYADALRGDGAVDWQEAEPVLTSIFGALGSGGTLFARLEPKGKREVEGVLRAVP